MTTYEKLLQLQADLNEWNKDFQAFKTELGDLHARTMKAVKK